VRFDPIIEMPCLLTGLWKRFSVHLFEGKVTLADMEEIEERSEKWHDKIRGKLVEMVVIMPSDAKMTSDERKKMTQIIKRWESSRVASATVILAQGLVGSMHRSVLTGLQLVVPAPHPVKVFGNTADAVKWLSPHIHELCGPESTPEALEAGVVDLSARFAAREKKAPPR
jgi:hypothetical protein